MTKTKSSFLVILMVIITFFTGVFSFGGINERKASALAADEKSGAIGYIYDTDSPTVDSTTMEDEFEDLCDISYYHLNSTNTADLQYAIDYCAAQCSGYDTACVIIDIKTFMPDPQLLNTWFSNLQNLGCITVFVTFYDIDEFPDDSFAEYVDLLIDNSEYSHMNAFFAEALTRYKNSFFSLVDTAYLLDGNRVHLGLEQDDEVDESNRKHLETLCASSPFLELFVKNLLTKLQYNEDITDYTAIADFLQNNNIRLLVHRSQNEFVEILKWESYTFTSIDDITVTSGLDVEKACAFGVSALAPDFYSSISIIRGENADLCPLYLMVVDPIQYDPNGLVAMIDINWNLDYIDQEEDALLAGLRSLLLPQS